MKWLQSLRAYTIELTLVAALLGAIGFFAYLGYGLVDPAAANPTFSGQQAMQHVNRLMEMGARYTGSDGNRAAGDWLIEELGQSGWSVYIQPFRVTAEEIQARNIIAVRGTGPTVMLTTHYDSRLYADQDGAEAQRTQPAPSANDSTAGTAILLELARTLAVEESRHEICLVFFDAGNNGGIVGWDADLGNRYFVEQIASLPRCGQPSAVVLVGGVGDMDQQIVRPVNGDAALMDLIWQIAAALDYTQWTETDDGAQPESQSFLLNYFATQQIPTAEINDPRYRYRATQADTANKLSPESLQRVGRVLEVWIEEGARRNAGESE